MSKYCYFATDGTYGDAKDLIVLDVSNFTGDDWDDIDGANDNDRRKVAMKIHKKREG